MAMTLGADATGDTISEINTTPLIDVMLVLLVMLIIAIPPVRHSVVLDTPSDPLPPINMQLATVHLAIDFDGVVTWNGEAVVRDEWEARMAYEARRSPQPELLIEPHSLADYGAVAAVMTAAQRNGLEKMGVVGGS